MKLEWDNHELQNWANNLSNVDFFNDAMEVAAKKITESLLNVLLNETPVDFGNLREAWNTSENNAFTVVKQQGGCEVTLYNRAEYAYWVNYGHKQTPGRFIPGYWNAPHTRFTYDRNANSGMVLKKSWVNGRFFVENSLILLKQTGDIQFYILEQLKEWWGVCCNGR